MLLADEIWLARFNGYDPRIVVSAPATQYSVDAHRKYPEQRLMCDEIIEDLVQRYTCQDMLEMISYHDSSGCRRDEMLGVCLTRFFNHQVNHQFRIQAHLEHGFASPSTSDWDCWHLL